MIRLIADLHTHTLASGHAYGTIREQAQAAAEAGLSMLGLTEHAPGVPGTAHPLYFNNLFTIPRTLYGVELLHGIVGIHRVCYTDEGIVKNTDNLIKCMADPKVRFVSHPDDNHTPLDYPALVSAAVELGVALEVNNSSFLKLDKRLGCLDNYRAMLSLCMELRCPIVVDSDAHDPSRVGKFEEAVKFLEEVGFDPSFIVNAEEERVRRFIDTGKL